MFRESYSGKYVWRGLGCCISPLEKKFHKNSSDPEVIWSSDDLLAETLPYGEKLVERLRWIGIRIHTDVIERFFFYVYLTTIRIFNVISSLWLLILNWWVLMKKKIVEQHQILNRPNIQDAKNYNNYMVHGKYIPYILLLHGIYIKW